MPTLQVIRRQVDPQAAFLAEQGKNIADAMYKQQALKMTGQYYKILAKNAQTEQDKFHMERLSKLNSEILPQIQATTDPTTKAMLIKAAVDSGMYGGDAQQFFHDQATSQPHIMRSYEALSQKGQSNPLTPNQPQTPPDAAMSLPNGGVGDAQGNQVASPQALAMMQQQAQQGQQGQQDQGQQPDFDPGNPMTVAAYKMRNEAALQQAQTQEAQATAARLKVIAPTEAAQQQAQAANLQAEAGKTVAGTPLIQAEQSADLLDKIRAARTGPAAWFNMNTKEMKAARNLAFQKIKAASVKPGMVEDGHRYLGGDPSKQANWEKV